MKGLNYGDKEVSAREIFYAVPSVVLGLGILSLPREIASTTLGLDGLISIAIAGVVALLATWMVAKLASLFPGQTFLDFSSKLISKPLAKVLMMAYGIYALLFVSYELRSVAMIAKLYLFNLTPIEALVLPFLLVVVYAVAGSRSAILRLNLVFLPVVLFMSLTVFLLNIPNLEVENMKPFLASDWQGIFQAVPKTIYSFIGFEVLLFYIAYCNQPSKAPRAAVAGMTIPVLLYLVMHFYCVSIFGGALSQILKPSLEMAKEIQVPGEFFERFESFSFTIWIMTLFNTIVMFYDISFLTFSSLFKKIKKHKLIFLLSPIIFIIAMMPQTQSQLLTFADFISYLSVIFSIIIPSILFIIAKWRGVKKNG
jgi:spore germination protein